MEIDDVSGCQKRPLGQRPLKMVAPSKLNRLGIRGTQCKSSIQDIMDEVAPVKKSPPMGLRADSFKCDVTRQTNSGPLTLFLESDCPKIAI